MGINYETEDYSGTNGGNGVQPPSQGDGVLVFGGRIAFRTLSTVCSGGGTIPLIREWLVMGMSMGSASAFMITGPATKITNLGALKIVLGLRRFLLYITFVMVFSLATGLIVNLVV